MQHTSSLTLRVSVKCAILIRARYILRAVRIDSFNRVGNAPRVVLRNTIPRRLTRGALPTRLNDAAAGWPGLESRWTKPRGFAKRPNPGHSTRS